MKNSKIRALKRRKKDPRTQLNISWHQEREKLKAKDLIYIVAITDYLPLMKKAVVQFLNRDDPNFDDFYRMLERAKEVLEKYKDLKENFWKKYLALCTIDNLAELTEAGEKEAATKLFNEIQKGSMRNNKAKQVLIRLFEKITNNEVRTDLWEKIKKLNPDEKELRYILDLPSMYSLYKMRSEAEKLLRQKHKTKENKTTKKLLDIAKQIKKGQK